MTDKTIRELQSSLPWTVHYHRDFRASPMTHKDFGHALLHVHKAAGKLASVVNDAEHGGSEFKPEEVDRFVADLVVCALRMANTCPGRVIDLQAEVEKRIVTKNAVEKAGEPQGTSPTQGATPDESRLIHADGGRYGNSDFYYPFCRQLQRQPEGVIVLPLYEYSNNELIAQGPPYNCPQCLKLLAGQKVRT